MHPLMCLLSSGAGWVLSSPLRIWGTAGIKAEWAKILRPCSYPLPNNLGNIRAKFHSVWLVGSLRWSKYFLACSYFFVPNYLLKPPKLGSLPGLHVLFGVRSSKKKVKIYSPVVFYNNLSTKNPLKTNTVFGIKNKYIF